MSRGESWCTEVAPTLAGKSTRETPRDTGTDSKRDCPPAEPATVAVSRTPGIANGPVCGLTEHPASRRWRNGSEATRNAALPPQAP